MSQTRISETDDEEDVFVSLCNTLKKLKHEQSFQNING